MLSSKVVMFAGKAHSGKDTCADTLAEILTNSGVEYVRTSFAEPVKSTLSLIFDVTFEGDKEAVKTLYFYRKNVRCGLKNLFNRVDTPMSIFSTSNSLMDIVVPIFEKVIRSKAKNIEDSQLVHGAFNFDASPRQLMQWFGTDIIRENVSKSLWVDMLTNRVTLAKEANPKVVTIVTDCRFDNEAKLCHSIGGCVIQVFNPESKMGEVASHVSENSLSPDVVDVNFRNPHSEGLSQMKARMRELADILGLIPHVNPYMDYRKASLELLPTSVITTRLDAATTNLVSLRKSLIDAGKYPRLLESLQDDINEVTKIVVGLSLELAKRK